MCRLMPLKPEDYCLRDGRHAVLPAFKLSSDVWPVTLSLLIWLLQGKTGKPHSSAAQGRDEAQEEIRLKYVEQSQHTTGNQ